MFYFFQAYYCEPYNIESYKNEHADILTSYFYLQQVNQTTVVVVGEFDVKKPVGPIMVGINILKFKIYLNFSGSKFGLFYRHQVQVGAFLLR